MPYFGWYCCLGHRITLEGLREEMGVSGQGMASKVRLTEKVVLKLFLARQCGVVAGRIELEPGYLFAIPLDFSVLTWEMGRIMLFPQDLL